MKIIFLFIFFFVDTYCFAQKNKFEFIESDTAVVLNIKVDSTRTREVLRYYKIFRGYNFSLNNDTICINYTGTLDTKVPVYLFDFYNFANDTMVFIKQYSIKTGKLCNEIIGCKFKITFIDNEFIISCLTREVEEKYFITVDNVKNLLNFAAILDAKCR
jgi:hypothetical protein